MGSFELIVSLNGDHFFNTEPQSMSNAMAHAKMATLMDRFPATEGFKVVCIRWETTGSEFTLEELAG